MRATATAQLSTVAIKGKNIHNEWDEHEVQVHTVVSLAMAGAGLFD